MTDWDREEAEQRIAELKAECDTLRRRILDGDDYREVQRLRTELEDAKRELGRSQEARAVAYTALRSMSDALRDGDIEEAAEIAYAWRKS